MYFTQDKLLLGLKFLITLCLSIIFSTARSAIPVLLILTVMICFYYNRQNIDWNFFQKQRPILIIFISFCLLAFISCFWALQPWQSLKQSVVISLEVLLCYILYYFLHIASKKQIELLMQILLWAVILSIIFIIIQFSYNNLIMQYVKLHRTIKPNLLIIFTIAIPICTYLDVMKQKKFLAYGILLIIFAILLINRPAFSTAIIGFSLGFIISIGFNYIKLIGKILPILFASITLCLPFIILQFVNNDIITFLIKNYTSYISFHHRLIGWNYAIKKIIIKPFSGYGAGASKYYNAPKIAMSWPGEGVCFLESISRHPHNHIIQVWFEYGLVGAIILALLHFYIFKWIARIKHQRIAGWIVFFAIIMMCILSTTHSLNHSWYVLWIGINGIFLLYLQKNYTKLQNKIKLTT